MAWSVRSEILLLLLCALLSAIGYAGVIAAPLVADDYSIWLGLTDGSRGLSAIGVRREVPFLRPVLGLSYWLEAGILGTDLGAHATALRAHNVLLHTLCAWLLGVVARRWTASATAGVVAAAAFACCPLHPEAVTWIAARGYPLGGCCTLVALWFALRWGAKESGAAALAGVAVFAAVAFLSVEPTLPLVAYPFLLSWALCFTRRGAWLSALLALVAVGYVAWRVALIGDLGGYRGGDGSSRHSAFAVMGVLRYLGSAVAHLVAPGPWDGADGVGLSWCVGLCAVCALGLHALSLRVGFASRRETIRRALALLACVVAALSVVASWATLTSDLAGARYLYFASMFWCVGLGWSAAQLALLGKRPRLATQILCMCLLAAQLVLLRAVNERWRVGGELAQAAVDGVVERVRTRGVRHVFLSQPPAEFFGAHALPWGMEAALAVRVGEHLRVDVVRDAAAFELIQKTHAAATPTERQTIDVGRWDSATRAWRWE